MPPTFGSESYRSTNPLEVINPKETTPRFQNPESIVGPDWIPEITMLSPSMTKVGAGNKKINIQGAQFLRTSIVVWNGKDVPTTFSSPTKLEVTVDTSAFQASKVPVAVRNNLTLSNIRTFTFTPATELE